MGFIKGEEGNEVVQTSNSSEMIILYFKVGCIKWVKVMITTNIIFPFSSLLPLLLKEEGPDSFFQEIGKTF